MGERGKTKKKSAILRGDRQKLESRCPNCGHKKNMECRKHGRHRHLYGATEVDKGNSTALK